MHKEGDAVTRPVADPLTRSLPRAEFNQRGAMPSAEELAAQQNVMRFRRELLGGATEAPQAMLLRPLPLSRMRGPRDVPTPQLSQIGRWRFTGSSS